MTCWNCGEPSADPQCIDCTALEDDIRSLRYIAAEHHGEYLALLARAERVTGWHAVELTALAEAERQTSTAYDARAWRVREAHQARTKKEAAA